MVELIDMIPQGYLKGVVIIVTVLLMFVMSLGGDILSKKRREIIERIGRDRVEEYYDTARKIYLFIEQEFRGQSGVSHEKGELFRRKMGEFIPEIKEEDIAFIRECVVGEFKENKEK